MTGQHEPLWKPEVKSGACNSFPWKYFFRLVDKKNLALKSLRKIKENNPKIIQMANGWVFLVCIVELPGLYHMLLPVKQYQIYFSIDSYTSNTVCIHKRKRSSLGKRNFCCVQLKILCSR